MKCPQPRAPVSWALAPRAGDCRFRDSHAHKPRPFPPPASIRRRWRWRRAGHHRRLPYAHRPRPLPAPHHQQHPAAAIPAAQPVVSSACRTRQYVHGRPHGRGQADEARFGRDLRIATNWSQIVRYILLSSPPPRIAKDRRATESASASSARAIRDVPVAAHQARTGVAELAAPPGGRKPPATIGWRGSAGRLRGDRSFATECFDNGRA